MEAFRLADLDPFLLEKVIAKLDPKSYFHLQQTCSGMHEFIRRNKHISIRLGEDYCFIKNWVKDFALEKSSPKLEFDKSDNSCKLRLPNMLDCKVDIADLYGIRLSKFETYDDAKDFDRICDCLRKYRITSEEVFINKTKWAKEAILVFLSIVKPRKVNMNSEGSDRYEVLFQSKSIEEVRIRLNPEDVAVVAPKLLLAFPEVNIQVRNADNQFNLHRTCLLILRSQPWPNLRYFNTSVHTRSSLTNATFAAVKARFRRYNVAVKKDVRNIFVFEMPQNFLATTSCRIFISRNSYSVTCRMLSK